MTRQPGPTASTPVLLVSPSATAGGAERAFAGLARTLPATGFLPMRSCSSAARWRTGCARPAARRTCSPAIEPGTSPVPRGRCEACAGWHAPPELGPWCPTCRRGISSVAMAAQAAGVPAVFWQHGIPGPSLIERVAGAIPAQAIACCSHAAASCPTGPDARSSDPQDPSWRPPSGPSDRCRAAARPSSGRWAGRATRPSGSSVASSRGRARRSSCGRRPRLAEARADIRFMVVGGAILGWEGSYPDDLRRLAADLGIADRVHFAGHQADVHPWYDALDVVVHASFGEPFGLVLVEAMALGKPLVATKLGGPLEIVEDGTSGLLVPPGDPERLAEAVERILADRGLAVDLEPGRSRTGQRVHRGAHGGGIRRSAQDRDRRRPSCTGRTCSADHDVPVSARQPSICLSPEVLMSSRECRPDGRNPHTGPSRLAAPMPDEHRRGR